MNRIQLFPSDDLLHKIESEANERGLSKSQVIVDALRDYYGMSVEGQPSLSELTSKVLDEIEEYVKDPNTPSEFSLFTASETFRSIEMTTIKKPATVRASIGRSFIAKIGQPPFSTVRKCIINGCQKLSVNNAITYIK